MKYTSAVTLAVALSSTANAFTFIATPAAQTRYSTKMFSDAEVGGDEAAAPATPAFRAGMKKGTVSVVMRITQ